MAVGPGRLHAVVRRARQGHRRRHGDAAGRGRLPLDRRRSEPALAARRTPRASTSTIEDISEQVGGAGAAGPDVGAACCARSADADIDALEYFRVTSGTHRRRAGRHLAHRLHRRPRLRDLDAARSRRVAVWDALMACRPRLRHQAGRHAGARRGARRGRAAAHRRRLHRQPEGADRRAEVHAVRDGARPAGATRQGAVRRAGGADSERTRAARGRMIVGLEVDWTDVEAIYDSGSDCAGRAGRGLAHGGAGDPRRAADGPGDDDGVVADAEAADCAGDDRRAARRRGTPLQFEKSRRSRRAITSARRWCRRRSSIRRERWGRLDEWGRVSFVEDTAPFCQRERARRPRQMTPDPFVRWR